MKLLIKQHVFSWTDTYDVYDEKEMPKYFVKAEAFTIGHRIHIYRHSDGEEVGMIREKLFSMFGLAEIYIGGAMVGAIRRRFSLFTPKYSMDYKGWDVSGDFLGWDYSIMDSSGRNVASISRELFHWGDTYSLEIYDGGDELAALITVIAIDMMNCER